MADVFSQFDTVGNSLAKGDAHFYYISHEHGPREPEPDETPGTVMSMFEISDTLTRRIDLVPKNTDAMRLYGPEWKVSAVEGEAGGRAAELLKDALNKGAPVRTDGVEVEFTRLPPGLGSLVGRRTRVSLQLGRARRRLLPWRARLVADTDRGREELLLRLLPSDSVPPGWDDAYVGEYAGMTVTLPFREHDSRRTIGSMFAYRRTIAPARAQRDALDFLHVVGGAGFFVVSGDHVHGTELRIPTVPASIGNEGQLLRQFFADVVLVERWAGTAISVPLQIDADSASLITRVARVLRFGRQEIPWTTIQFPATSEDIERVSRGGAMLVENTAEAQIFGKVVSLGRRRVGVNNFKVVDVAEADGDGLQLVTLAPRQGKEGVAQWWLVRERHQKPPQNPPKQGTAKWVKKKRRRR